MLVRNIALKHGLGLIILALSGLGLLNVSLFQMALPAVAVAPGTPTVVPSIAIKDSRTITATVNSKLAPTPTATVPPQTYVVQADDNIFRIAQKVYGDSVKFSLILKANNLSEDSRLVPGAILKIPYLATPTFTTTPTSRPLATSTPNLPTVTLTITVAPMPSAVSKTPPIIKPEGAISDSEQAAIMAMLTTFTTSTLVGSSIICGFLAFGVYTSARRAANQQAMSRRVRPPLKR